MNSLSRLKMGPWLVAVPLSAVLLSVATGCRSTNHKGSPTTTPPQVAEVTPTQPQSASSVPAAATATPSTQAPAPTPAAEPATPVLVFLGGNSSCILGSTDTSTPLKQSLGRPFDLIRTNVETVLKRPSAHLVACYGPDSGNISYVLSSDDTKVRVESLDSMYLALNALLATIKNPRVFIVGHSHGGWTAMDLTLKLDHAYPLAALVTLDPISRVQCTPTSILAASLSQKIEPNCLVAPTDFGDDKLAAMQKRAGVWLNFYEDASVLLHSGVLKGALNTHEPYSSGGVDSHSQFLHDDALTATIQDVILKGMAQP